jgi:uncharacterized protein (TIGR02594 family)
LQGWSFYKEKVMSSGGTRSSEFQSPPEGSPKYLVEAYNDLGVKEYITEKRKRKPNPTVQAWSLPVLGYKVNTITVPWCAIYVGAKLEAVGYTCTKSAMARSYLKWGKVIDHGDDSKWKVGDIGVTWRGSHNDGVTGHVFFIVGWDDDYLYALGGNQGDSVCVQRVSRRKLLGVRRPRTVIAPKTMKGLAVAVGAKAAEKTAAYSLPEPDQVNQLVDTARGPIETLGGAKPWIIGILGVVSVAATLYAMWWRMRDFNSGQNT